MKKALHTNHAHPREDMDCRRRPREVCRKGIYMKITRPIRAVLFDMDGVMVDSEFVYMKYLLEFAKEKNHLQPDRLSEDLPPGDEDHSAGIKAPRLYSRAGILHRSEADLEDRGGGGHAPGI